MSMSTPTAKSWHALQPSISKLIWQPMTCFQPSFGDLWTQSLNHPPPWSFYKSGNSWSVTPPEPSI